MIFHCPIVAGGTFALYSLICRHAKVSLLPNQLPSDARISSFRLKVPSPELERSLKIKERLESSLTLKKVILILVLAGTAMVIADGVVTPAMSGILSFLLFFICFPLYTLSCPKQKLGSFPFRTLACLYCSCANLYSANAVMSAVGGLRIGVSAIEHGNSMLSITMLLNVTSCVSVLSTLWHYPN